MHHVSSLPVVLAGYVDQLRRGSAPDRATLLAEHPHLVEELTDFFAHQDAALSDSQHGLDVSTVDARSEGPLHERPTRAFESTGATDSAGSFGDYELLGEVARGGMGVVYRARQKSANRIVALKMILGGRLPGSDAVQRFFREAETAARLDHPNIVPIYEVGQWNDNGREAVPFFSMKLIEGGSLTTWIAGQGPALFTIDGQREGARIMAQVARAVHHAHQRGLIHRDLKPGNILLAACGLADGARPQAPVEPYVTDFGLARPLETDGQLTQSGAILGTPEYMAPEQAVARKDLTTAADVYGLGAILYALLAGRPPFRGTTVFETLQMVANEEPAPARQANPQVDRDLETICLKCLEKEPSRRYASAAALADDLEHWLAGEPIEARPAGAGERLLKWARRRPAIAALVASLFVVTAVGFALVFWQWQVAQDAYDKQTTALGVAESEKKRAEDAKKDADSSAQEAARQRDNAQTVTARMALTRALALGDEGDVNGALLWLVRGLEMVPASNPELARVLQTNITAHTRMTWPVRAMMVQRRTGVPPSEFAGVRISANGQVVAGFSGREVNFWDASGRLLGRCSAELGATRTVVLSPDGKTACFSRSAGTLDRVDTGTGNPIGPPLQSGARVECLTSSPDGRLLAALTRALAGGTTSLWVWDAAGGSRLAGPINGLKGARITFSPDGKTILLTAIGPGDGPQIFDAHSGQPAGVMLQVPAGVRVSEGVFRPDGKAAALAISSRDGHVVQLYDLATGKPAGRELRHPDEVPSLAFDGSGTQLLTGCRDGKARLWQLDSARVVQEQLHVSNLIEVAFAADGATFISVAGDRSVSLRHTQSLQLPGHLLQQQGNVSAAHFQPGGRLLATITGEGRVTVWERPEGLAARPPLPHAAARHVCIAPNGEAVLVLDWDGGARLWNPANNLPIADPLPHRRPVLAGAFHQDGKTLLTLEGDLGSIQDWSTVAHLWDARTGKEIGTDIKHPQRLDNIILAPDGKSYLAAAGSKTALIDLRTGQPMSAPMVHPDGIKLAAFRPDGKALATASRDGSIRLWALPAGTQIGITQQQQEEPFCLAWSPDGSLFVTGGRDRNLRRWDGQTGQLAGAPMLHQGTVMAVAFAPGGKTLATGSADRMVRLWNVADGKTIGPAMPHRGTLLAVAFSPDGKVLASAGRDQVARLWDVALGQPISPRLPCPGQASDVHFFTDSKHVLVGSAADPGPISGATITEVGGKGRVRGTWQMHLQVWDVPEVRAEPLRRLRPRSRVLTGMDMDANDAIGILDPTAWQRDRDQLAGPKPVR